MIVVLAVVGVGCDKVSSPTTMSPIMLPSSVTSTPFVVSKHQFDACTGGPASPAPTPSSGNTYGSFAERRKHRDDACTIPSPYPIIKDISNSAAPIQIGPNGAVDTNVVGELVTLQVVMSDGSPINSASWTAPSAIKGYKFPKPFTGTVIGQTVQYPMGTILNFAANDLQSQTISFYYIDGNLHSVEVQVGTNSGAMKQSGTINTLAPIPHVSTTFSPNGIILTRHFGGPNGNGVPRFVDGVFLDGASIAASPLPGPDSTKLPYVLAPNAAPGISWIYSVTGSPATKQNKLFITQELQQCVTLVGRKNSFTYHFDPQLRLDTTAPYGVPSIIVPADQTYSANDSPGLELDATDARIKRQIVNDKFKDYFMFQSGKDQNTIPVTLGTFGWQMLAQVSRTVSPGMDAGAYVRDAVSKVSITAPFTSSTELPVWQGVLGHNDPDVLPSNPPASCPL